jgi:hypothetical protein
MVVRVVEEKPPHLLHFRGEHLFMRVVVEVLEVV